ncbi:hypothetical protein DWB84_16625 [Saccharophagus sp. K07]|uniref:hypothetical protein n=1 Tax=Saccharophagus sp. K07 TaxID=2283636 RepID=UPI0016522018|nr:hypothetical protein [Saccharophagus sp. K07]MBC6907072.1 hypothetical protein [Saccharophagus sp. K07]
MTAETYNLVNVWLYSISALIALIMLGIALFQLKGLTDQVKQAVKSNSINQLNALLSLEQQIADRRLSLSKAGIELAELKDSEDQNKIDSCKLKFDEAKQMYLNGLDRLCFCVLKSLLDSEDMRLEYREIINSAVKDFSEDFHTATPYRNVKKVYEQWADK